MEKKNEKHRSDFCLHTHNVEGQNLSYEVVFYPLHNCTCAHTYT